MSNPMIINAILATNAGGNAAAHGAVLAKVQREGAGVDAFDAGHALTHEEVGQAFRGAPVGRLLAAFLDDEGGHVDFFGFHVLGVDAVVADERIGKDYNLSAERRVRQGFLIAAHACCEDDFTNSRMVPIKGSFIDTTIF